MGEKREEGEFFAHGGLARKIQTEKSEIHVNLKKKIKQIIKIKNRRKN